ncbi:MAG: hypothetical protein R3A52_26645 [Polyangiales bacterium]
MNDVVLRAVQGFEGMVRLIEVTALRWYGDRVTIAIDPRLVDQLRRWMESLANAAESLDANELATLQARLPIEDDMDAIFLCDDLARVLDARGVPAPLSSWEALAWWISSVCHCSNATEPFASELARDPERVGLVVSTAVSWEALSGVSARLWLSYIVDAATPSRPDLPTALERIASTTSPWLATRARAALESSVGARRSFTDFGLATDP